MKKQIIISIYFTAFILYFPVPGVLYAETFFDMGNGTIYDEERSLLWQKSDDGVIRYFDDAISYCNNLSLDGKENWILPTVELLSSLVNKDYHPTINPLFSSKASEYYSSTTQTEIATGPGGVGKGSTTVKIVDFSTGDIISESTYKVNNTIAIGYTRCVIVGYSPLARPLDSYIFLLLKPE